MAVLGGVFEGKVAMLLAGADVGVDVVSGVAVGREGDVGRGKLSFLAEPGRDSSRFSDNEDDFERGLELSMALEWFSISPSRPPSRSDLDPRRGDKFLIFPFVCYFPTLGRGQVRS
jgi:hypothetical protein